LRQLLPRCYLRTYLPCKPPAARPAPLRPEATAAARASGLLDPVLTLTLTPTLTLTLIPHAHRPRRVVEVESVRDGSGRCLFEPGALVAAIARVVRPPPPAEDDGGAPRGCPQAAHAPRDAGAAAVGRMQAGAALAGDARAGLM